jgi:hypothetical protein
MSDLQNTPPEFAAPRPTPNTKTSAIRRPGHDCDRAMTPVTLSAQTLCITTDVVVEPGNLSIRVR